MMATGIEMSRSSLEMNRTWSLWANFMKSSPFFSINGRVELHCVIEVMRCVAVVTRNAASTDDETIVDSYIRNLRPAEILADSQPTLYVRIVGGHVGSPSNYARMRTSQFWKACNLRKARFGALRSARVYRASGEVLGRVFSWASWSRVV
jgi:hypothetical protein